MNQDRFSMFNARLHDVDEAIAFLNERGGDLLRSGPIESRGSSWQERWLNQEWTRHILIRFREDQSIVAVATMHVRYTWRRGIGMIEYVLADEDHRGNGLGSALIDELIRQACEELSPQLDKLELLSEPEHPEARRLYRSRGFKLVEGSDRHFELSFS
jgi:RimJ/RimL family protein N-acetyltransferase